MAPNFPRLICIFTFCTGALFFLPNAAWGELEIPQHDPDKLESILGKPEDLINRMEAGVKEDLDQYLGLALAASGFILALRVLSK